MLHYFFKLFYPSELHVFWLAEDINDHFPDARCVFPDARFKYLKISCQDNFEINEIRWLFTFYGVKPEKIWKSQYPEDIDMI